MQSPADVDRAVALFHALSDATRLGILEMLKGGERCVCELQDELDDGSAVTLRRGAVMFHAADTTHNAKARRYWAGLTHQPRGITLTP